MYRRLSEHITELLKKHSCVIVPGLGGFVTNYKPAVINHKTDIFSPPSLEVAFNTALTHNDGLLLESLSKYEKCTLAEAETKLNQAITALRRELFTNGSVELEGLGLLYLDKNLNINFRSALKANLHPQSFGLKSFRLPSIKNRRQSATYEFEYMTREKNNRSLVASVVAASIVVVLGLAILINDKISPHKSQEASMVTVTESSPASSEAGVKKSGFAEISTSKKQALFYSGNDDPVEYHIIAGSFNNRAAAEKVLTTFSGEGMHATILEDAHKYRISIYSSSDKYEALRQLDFYRLTVSKDLWLLKRNPN